MTIEEPTRFGMPPDAVQYMLDNPGFYLATSPHPEHKWAIVPIASVSGKLFAMRRDQELRSNGYIEGTRIDGPFEPGDSNQWRPIEFAPKDEIVDCHDGENRFTNCWWSFHKQEWEFRGTDGIAHTTLATHWMPIPEGPKEGV